MEVDGWLLVLALFFTVLIGLVLLVALRIDTKLDYMNRTLLKLLGAPASSQRSATVAQRAQHRLGE